MPKRRKNGCTSSPFERFLPCSMKVVGTRESLETVRAWLLENAGAQNWTIDPCPVELLPKEERDRYLAPCEEEKEKEGVH
jgi:hypothetical protein